MPELIETPMHGKSLTVGGLIEELGKFDLTLPVLTEGCDCYGSAFRVTEWSSGNELFVLVEREPLVQEPWPGQTRFESEASPPHPDLL